MLSRIATQAVKLLKSERPGGPSSPVFPRSSFCREFSLRDAPETRVGRGGAFELSTKGIILSSVLTRIGGFSVVVWPSGRFFCYCLQSDLELGNPCLLLRC